MTKKKRKKASGPKIDRRRSTVTDADIVGELSKNGGMIGEAALTLKVRYERVTAVNQKYGGLAALKKRESAYAAVEQAVISIAAVIETMRKGDGADAKDMAIAGGVMVDKLLLLAGKPNFIARNDNNSKSETTTAAVTVDFADLVQKLSREEVERLMDMRDKLNGVDTPPDDSDLDNPEVYDPDTYQPPPLEGTTP